MKFLFVLLLVSMVQTVIAQTTSQAFPEKLMDQARKKYQIPGISISIMSSSEIYYSSVRGNRIHDQNTPIQFEDFFHIGSCSKSVLATIAAKAVEEELVDWNTRFFDLFPEIEEEARQDYSAITLQDLFLCQAGIKPYVSGEEIFPEIDVQSKDAKLSFAKYMFILPPSSRIKPNGSFEFLYSNASYALASLMIEKATENNYEELIDEFFSGYLHVNHLIGFPNKQDEHQPWGHLISSKNIEVFDPENPYEVLRLIRPAGDLSLKTKGFAKFVQMHLKGLSGDTSYLHTRSFEHVHFGFNGFSLGVSNGNIAGKRFSGMDGSTGTFFCRGIIFPKDDFAFTIMTNAGSGTGQMPAVDWLTKKILKRKFGWWWKLWY